MNKESRRVKMTKMLLNESFLKFLAEKPLARITIKEICEDADANRSTYYAHFTDPYDQLKKLEADIMVDMTIFVDSIMTEGLHSEKKTAADDQRYFRIHSSEKARLSNSAGQRRRFGFTAGYSDFLWRADFWR